MPFVVEIYPEAGGLGNQTYHVVVTATGGAVGAVTLTPSFNPVCASAVMNPGSLTFVAAGATVLQAVCTPGTIYVATVMRVTATHATEAPAYDEVNLAPGGLEVDIVPTTIPKLTQFAVDVTSKDNFKGLVNISVAGQASVSPSQFELQVGQVKRLTGQAGYVMANTPLTVTATASSACGSISAFDQATITP